MPILKDNEGLPREVHIQKLWIEIPLKNGESDRFVVNKKVANYIEKLENENTSLKRN